MVKPDFSKFISFFKRIGKNIKFRLKKFFSKENGLRMLGKTKRFFIERIGLFIFIVLVALAILIGYKRIQIAKSNAITFTEDYEAPARTATLTDEGEYVTVAKNESLELLYNSAKGAIEIINLENGYVWKSICDNDVYNLKSGINKQWALRLQSAISIKYNDLKKKDSGVTQIFSAKDCGYLETEEIPNGISVTYGFLTPGLYVTVEYSIDGDNLVVRVPYDKIRELSKYAITTVEVIPFLGACMNENDGYLFYPDGCGAISTFAKVDERPSSVKFASYYTYSPRTISMESFVNDYYARYTATMPVCGLKNGDNAFVAFGTEGAEDIGVQVYPSGIVVDLNHIGFEVYTRNIYQVSLYNMSSSADTVATGAIIQRVDKHIIKEDKEIRYAFLCGADATYSGMAAKYKEYLVESGQLVKSEEHDNGYPLALRLLMGTEKSGLIYDEYIKMTTFGQTYDIASALKEKGVMNTNLVLEDWMKDSEDYEYWGPSMRLGGTSGLKKLSQYAAENDDINVFLEEFFSFASSKTSGLNEDDDVAYNGLNIEISIDYFDGTIEYLLNPIASADRNSKLLKKLKKYDGLGVAYSDVGRVAFMDFNEINPLTKSETVDVLRGIFAKTSDSGRNVAVRSGSQYSFADTDYMYGLKEDAYGLSITDYAVPFVQMVLSGYIPYSSENPGNLAYDLQTQKLKWVEFGSMPYFYLTAESALNLRDTGRDLLFSSTYADWEPVMIETYNEFKDSFSEVYNKQIVEHYIFSENVRKTVYENGITVYVNYGNSDADVEGVTVPANNYVVSGGSK